MKGDGRGLNNAYLVYCIRVSLDATHAENLSALITIKILVKSLMIL